MYDKENLRLFACRANVKHKETVMNINFLNTDLETNKPIEIAFKPSLAELFVRVKRCELELRDIHGEGE
jgi:hypothetical protein